MLNTALTSIAIISMLELASPVASFEPQPIVLSERELSLQNRHPVESVNEVFKDNILLNMSYLKSEGNSNLNWDEVRKPFKYEFKLEPNQTFAFHEDVLDEYKGKVSVSTNAHFNSSEGFKNSGYLVGDGVCHLASLMYLAAKTASLDTKALSNHDFAAIPDISREYGVAIYNEPGSPNVGANQNLYITNNKGNPVLFKFEYLDNKLKLSIVEVK